MSEFLVLTLECKMASFGDLAGHERRGSEVWPGKSALTGLIGGAMGVKRDDGEGQRQLRTLSFAVAAFDTGVTLRDFHTVQSVHQKIKNARTRALALAEGRKSDALNTSITLRDYRCSVLYAVAVWGGELQLDAVSTALKHPVFVPYLGRKSCPLSAPMAPQVVEADDPLVAIDKAVLPPWRLAGKDSLRPVWQFLASDPHSALNVHSVEWRHDEAIDRRKWHFQPRQVHIVREETR